MMEMGRPLLTEVGVVVEEGEADVGEDDSMFARGEYVAMVRKL